MLSILAPKCLFIATPSLFTALVQALVSACLNSFKSSSESSTFLLLSVPSSTLAPEVPSKSKSNSLSLSENPLIFIHMHQALCHDLLSHQNLSPVYLFSLISGHFISHTLCSSITDQYSSLNMAYISYPRDCAYVLPLPRMLYLPHLVRKLPFISKPSLDFPDFLSLAAVTIS